MMSALLGLSVAELIGRIAVVAAAIGIFVQVTPIKFNPLSWLAKKIGRAMNGEWQDKMDTRMDSFDIKVDKLEAKLEESNAKNNRTKILRFGDEILREDLHSKDHFDEILMCITEYEQYCRDHPQFKNHITEITTKRILATYEKCFEKNSFL